MLFDFGSIVQFFPNVEQSFFVLHALTVVFHALDTDYSSLSEHPSQKVDHNIFVSERSFSQNVVTEEVKRADEQSSGVVEALDSCSESDGRACSDGLAGLVIFGEGGGLRLDEIVKLVIFIIDQVHADSAIEQRSFSFILGEERSDVFVVEGGDECGRFVVIEMVFKLSTQLVQLDPKGIEQFPIGKRGIDISNDDHIASFVEVGDDVSGLNLTVGIFIQQSLPLSEVHMTTMCWYLNRSQYFSSMLFLPKLCAISTWCFPYPFRSSKNWEWVVSSCLLSRMTRILSPTTSRTSSERIKSFPIDLITYVPTLNPGFIIKRKDSHMGNRRNESGIDTSYRINHLVNFMMALTESSPVSLKTLMASALVHLVYSTTILMLSGVSPSSFKSSAVVSTLAAVSADGASTLASSVPSGVTGFLNWLISFCPVWRPSMLGFPKMIQEFSFPGVFQTSGSSMLMTKAFPFLMVTLLIPVTGLSPILVIAFLNFFSPLLDLGSRSSPSTSCS